MVAQVQDSSETNETKRKKERKKERLDTDWKT
jgi:hypothetical protein